MRSGITRRWLRGNLLITVLVVLLAEAMFLYSYTRSYYGSVQQIMYRRFSSVTGQLKVYTADTVYSAAANRSMALRRGCLCSCPCGIKKARPRKRTRLNASYSMTLDTTPEPTVRPPSRIAKRRPCSMAMGVISVISMSMLSPGITISTPSGSLMLPVTSVVRK